MYVFVLVSSPYCGVDAAAAAGRVLPAPARSPPLHSAPEQGRGSAAVARCHKPQAAKQALPTPSCTSGVRTLTEDHQRLEIRDCHQPVNFSHATTCTIHTGRVEQPRERTRLTYLDPSR
eukprot:scaffold1691_cov107-Isochrysis_galbana.AAC.12